ncbi:hypothetical protein ACFPIJ_42300 [Dactylosporangium cerinum]|uniref:Uncharacterized protein n=1 Tax=Dactylosporangium cerinum TaxID=1434730 RepID=A0ABV9W9J6_9ACTN
MNGTKVRWVLLYRTPTKWRISVAEVPDAIACGDLPDTPPDAPIEVAQHDLEAHLRRHWNFTGELTWSQTEPDSWAAEPTPSTENVR